MSDDENQDKMPLEEDMPLESENQDKLPDVDESKAKTAPKDENLDKMQVEEVNPHKMQVQDENPDKIAAEEESKDKTPSEESTTSESTKQEEPKAATSSQNVTYEDGVAIYTDEVTKYKYKWCKDTNQWKPMENEHYKWDEKAQKWIPKASLENEYYRWCDKTNQWIPKMKQSGKDEAGVYGYDEKEGCQIYTDQDGAVFFWVCGNAISVLNLFNVNSILIFRTNLRKLGFHELMTTFLHYIN